MIMMIAFLMMMIFQKRVQVTVTTQRIQIMTLERMMMLVTWYQKQRALLKIKKCTRNESSIIGCNTDL